MIDFCRTTNNIVIDTSAEYVMQQIDILFDTSKGEVLGDIDYGSDYDKFLHELNVGNKYVEQYIYDNITQNVELYDWTLNVNVQFLIGTLNDIILLTVELSKNNDVFEKTYKIDTTVVDTII